MGKSKRIMYSNAAIESQAVIVIKSLVNKHPLLDPQINDHDKIPLYDGSIVGYQTSGQNRKNKDWDFMVPVQFKGHIDRQGIRRKRNVVLQVPIDDLCAYFKEHGVFYFHVYFDEDLANEEVFYCLLHQAKIKEYLDMASRKKHKSSIGVIFNKLDKRAQSELYWLLKQFDHDSKNMMSQTVERMVRLDSDGDIRAISFTAFGKQSNWDIASKIANGDICVFTSDNGPVDFPVEWIPGMVVSLTDIIHTPVSVAGRTYYTEYQVESTSQETAILKFSDNVTAVVHPPKMDINFKANSGIEGLCRDAGFILSVIKEKGFYVGVNKIPLPNFSVPENSIGELLYYKELGEALEMLDMHIPGKFIDLPAKEKEDLACLVRVKREAYGNCRDGLLYKYQWAYGEHIIPLLMLKDGDKVTLYDRIYGCYQVYVALEGEEDKQIPVPSFAGLTAEELSHLYRLDEEFFYKQIDDVAWNEITCEALTNSVLAFIGAYDMTKQKRFLKFADYLAGKIEATCHQDVYVVNRLQIKKRLSPLCEEDVQELMGLSDSDPLVAFGKYALLGEEIKAKEAFERMSGKDQKKYLDYPIHTLYKELSVV